MKNKGRFRPVIAGTPIDLSHEESLRRDSMFRLLSREIDVESATFRKWLADRGCRFEPGNDTGAHGHAFVTVHLGDRKAVLPEVGSHKALDPRTIRQIVDDLGLDWNELPGPASRV